MLGPDPERMGFVKNIFWGNFREELVFPWPQLSPEETARCDQLLAELDEYLRNEHPTIQIDRDQEIPDWVIRRFFEIGVLGMIIPTEYGGRDLGITSYNRVLERIGYTCGSTAVMVSAHLSIGCGALMLFGNEQQQQRYLPLMATEMLSAFCLSEPNVGCDAAGQESRCELSANGEHYILNGEKWYVTSGNLADFFWFQGRIPDEDEDALFLVDQGTAGIEITANPKFSHTYAAHHPTYRFTDVRVSAAQRVGQSGDGMSYTRSWFRHERLMIGARSCGAAARLIEDAMEFAKNRTVDGLPLSEKQAIQFMLADCTTELYAARLMTYDAARSWDRGDDLKAQHARCSMTKLYVSEMANRVADRAVQIFGGRGYMRENVAERFFRELRVDRIWEGTSEIQRLIIARSLLKRGLDGM